MHDSNALRRFCESWWGRPAQAARTELVQAAEQFLGLLGWAEPAPLACPGDAARTGATSYLLQRGAYGTLAAHFVAPGMLTPPGAVVESGLDFCLPTRWLVSATQAMNVPYAFITDLFRAYLYDTRKEDLLLTADGPEVIARDFGATLEQAAVREGALEELRRPPRSQTARRLREWEQRWYARLRGEWQLPEEPAWLAMDRLVLLRYLVEQNSLKRPGWSLRDRYLALIAQADGPRPDSIGLALLSLYHQLWSGWQAALFSFEPRLDAALEQSALTLPLVRELGLLSRAKFALDTILESFNYGDAAEKARVRMIPEADEERLEYLRRQTTHTIGEVQVQVDLADEGYRAICLWFDQVAALYERLGRDYDRQQTGREQGQGYGDLFAWSEADASRPQAFQEPLHHAVEQGLKIYYISPRQYRTARLMLYLHFLESCKALRAPVIRFPRIESALWPRPGQLDSDRRRIFGTVPDQEWEAL